MNTVNGITFTVVFANMSYLFFATFSKNVIDKTVPECYRSLWTCCMNIFNLLAISFAKEKQLVIWLLSLIFFYLTTNYMYENTNGIYWRASFSVNRLDPAFDSDETSAEKALMDNKSKSCYSSKYVTSVYHITTQILAARTWWLHLNAVTLFATEITHCKLKVRKSVLS